MHMHSTLIYSMHSTIFEKTINKKVQKKKCINFLFML